MPLYSLYIPKHSGTLSILPTVVRDFVTTNTNHNKQFEVVISPGYLGEGESFSLEVTNILAGHVSSLIIYRGMTSEQRHRNSTAALRAYLGVDVSPAPTKYDHRKMIFFRFGGNTEAILIGSSNFSYATYFMYGKGEADLFLFYNESFKKDCRNNIVGSQTRNGSNNPQEKDNDNSKVNSGAEENNSSVSWRSDITPRNAEGYRYCVLSESIEMNYEPQEYLNTIYTEFTKNA